MTSMWGYQTRRTTLRHAPFVCARCGLDRIGTEIEPQRWFTVLGMRLVPLAAHDRVIECDTCGHQCDTGAWEIPTTEMLAALLVDATRFAAVSVATATAARTGSISPAVTEAAVTAIRDADDAYDEPRLARDIERLPVAETADRLRPLVAELTAHGKQGFLRRMSTIAIADGPMEKSSRRALLDVGLALGMAAPHIHGVIAVAALQFEAA